MKMRDRLTEEMKKRTWVPGIRDAIINAICMTTEGSEFEDRIIKNRLTVLRKVIKKALK